MSDLLYFILSCVLVVGSLAGISFMSKANSSIWGNLAGVGCMVCAVMLTMVRYKILTMWELWAAMLVGLAAALLWAYRIKMIQMPQAVGLFNACDSAASAIISAVSLVNRDTINVFDLATAGVGLALGGLAVTGSIVAVAKLTNVISQKPRVWKGHRAMTVTFIALTLLSVIAVIAMPEQYTLPCVIACAVFSGAFGFAFAMRVGGADMPITISLLNAISGVAGAVAGMAVSEPLLVAVGGIVGASGLLLTQIMCRAMNRSLWDILTGKTSVAAGSSLAEWQEAVAGDEDSAAGPAGAPDPLELLKAAQNVIFVPGYGMALAQAQHLVKRLADILEGRGARVRYGIHPVAGRMPGHMNVLLAEAEVEYDSLFEMDEINPMFPESDLVVIIGANDVVNPAANTAQGTPIYGMPILNAGQAKHLIICNYDLKPGYAGVDNPLYRMPNVAMCTGDAAETLQRLIDGMD